MIKMKGVLKMKKTLISVLAAGLILALSACSGENAPAAPTKETNSAETAQIKETEEKKVGESDFTKKPYF
jgi:PBP1b-binding outer membrane lipoprotein LpoB